MDVYHEFLLLNEYILNSKGNITKLSKNLMFWDTRDENYHFLNTKFNEGFILISENSNKDTNYSEIDLLNQHRENIFHNENNNSLKVCICQELNSTVSRNSSFTLMQFYSHFLGVNLKQNCNINDELIVLGFNYKYLIIESKLLPLSLEDIRELVYLLSLQGTKLNQRFIFFVEDNKNEQLNEKTFKTLYIVLSPKNNDNESFDVSVIYLPIGYLEKHLCNTKYKKIPIKSFINHGNSTDDLNFEVISRYDIIREMKILNDSKEETNSITDSKKDEAIFYEELMHSKCINILQGTHLTILIKWNLGINETLYPNIPKPNHNCIENGLFLLKIDENQMNDNFLTILTNGFKSLEWLIYCGFDEMALNEDDNSVKSIVDEVSQFIHELSEIWSYPILANTGILELNKENQFDFIKNGLISKHVLNRLDMDYIDYLWHYIKDLRDLKLIYKIFIILMNEFEKSFMQQFYENRFIPQVRNENKTIFADLIRLGIEIYKYKLYNDQKYKLKQEQDSSIKEQVKKWKSIKKTYFEEIKNLKYVLIQMGFECIITDIKLIIKKSEPLLNDKIFNWHINDLYLESRKLLNDFNFERLQEINIELLKRIKLLLPVCYISQLISSNKFTWDISRKIINSSIKYYSDPSNSNISTVFVVPVYDKNLITQYILSKSPDQVEISSVNHENSISFSKINNAETLHFQCDLKESVQLFNRVPVNIWKTLSEIEVSSNVVPIYYSVLIKENLTN